MQQLKNNLKMNINLLLNFHKKSVAAPQNQHYQPYHQNLARLENNNSQFEIQQFRSMKNQNGYQDANQQSVLDLQSLLRSTSQFSVAGSQVSNAGPKSIDQLPKIKQLLIKKELSLNPYENSKLLQDYQSSMFKQLTMDRTYNPKMPESEQSILNQLGVTPSLFYTQYNFNVVHSKTKKDLRESRSNQFKIYQNNECSNWDESVQLRTQDTNIHPNLRKTMFKAAGYRNQKIQSSDSDLKPNKINEQPKYFKAKHASQSVSPQKLNSLQQSIGLYESDPDETYFNFKKSIVRKQDLPTNVTINSVLKSNFNPEQSQPSQILVSQEMNITDSIEISAGHQTQSQMVMKKNLDTDLDLESKKELRNQYSKQLKPIPNQEITQKLKIAYAQNASTEESYVRRQENLSKRNKKLRALSARNRDRILAQQMEKQGRFQDSQGSDVEDYDDQATYYQTRDQYRTNSFQSALQKSTMPRLTDLSMRDQVESFISVMEQAAEIYGCDKMFGDDQQIVDEVYNNYIEKLQRYQAQKYKSLKTESDLTEQDIPQSQTVAKKMDKYSMLIGLKFRQKISDMMLRMANIPEYLHRINKIDREILKKNEIQAQLLQRDQIIVALSLIGKNHKKQAGLKYSKDSKLVDQYAMLLQDDCEQEANKTLTQEKIETQNLATKIRPKINRGFLIFHNDRQQNIGDHDFNEQVNDPEQFFDEYLQRNAEAKQVAGEEIYNRYADHLASQNYNNNSTLSDMSDTRVQFIKTSTHYQDLALPLMSKIKNKQLNLVDYNLSTAHFLALTSVFDIDPQILSAITLVNCGVTDQNLTILLQGCSKLAELREITVTNGEVGMNSVEALTLLVQLKGLQKLNFKDIRMQSLVAEKLFGMLHEESYIKSLSLVGFQFTEHSFALFTKYFESNQFLEELDISYPCGLRPFWYVKFFVVLSRNILLKKLNLAGNSFIESQQHARKLQENPYFVFNALMERWKKMGPGIKFPAYLVGPDGKLIGKKKKLERTSSAKGKRIVEIPKFKEVNEIDELITRQNKPSVTQRDNTPLTNKNFQLLLKKRLGMKFDEIQQNEADKNYVSREKFEQFKRNIRKEAELDLLIKDEEVSEMALVVTEAIYKFLRRNQQIQHLDISNCNLTQVMCGRIALGVKCSSTMMGFHLSGNPGVTTALKQYLLYKMKAYDALEEPMSDINNQFIEQNQNLGEELNTQLQNNYAEQSLVHDTVKIRSQFLKKLSMKQNHPQDPNTSMQKTLVFTRLIAHKKEIPNSGRWKMLTQPHQECWICSNYTLTYFFWNCKSIDSSQVPEHLIEKGRLITKLAAQTRDAVPIIWGNFTNWKPHNMMLVEDFAKMHQNKKVPNFLKLVVKAKKLGWLGISQFSQLDFQGKQLYQELENSYENEYKVNWRRNIGSMLRYKQPCLAGMEHYNKHDDYDSDEEMNPQTQTYVYAALVRPGKHYYLIKHNQEEEKNLNTEPLGEGLTLAEILKKLKERQKQVPDQKFSLFKQIIPLRIEQLPLLKKEMKGQLIELEFMKHNSVFRPWKEDTKQILQDSFELDWAQQKIGKLIPKEEERIKLKNMVQKHYSYIKNIHIDFLCHNDISFVNVMDFIQFGQKCQFPDKIMTQANIDLIFVQCDSYYPKTTNNLKRAHFIEALIRIAKQKLYDQQIIKNMDLAYDHLVKEYIKKYYGVVDQWQQVRKQIFWTLEVNDLLFANLAGLKSIFNFYLTHKKKWMDKKEAIDMMTSQLADIHVNQINAKKCFTMAKMTVVDEENTFEKHNRLTFVEYLEMICRIAYYHFEDLPEQKTLPYIKKLELILDQVLAMRFITRKDPVKEVLIDSDIDVSDGDY